MTLGEKIHKYRILKEMSLKDLGIAVGFKPSNASSRFKRYEVGDNVPRPEMRDKIAAALDVSISALSDIDVRDEEDIMQILFLLEEDYGLQVNKNDSGITLSFDDSSDSSNLLNSYLNSWYNRKELYLKSVKSFIKKCGNLSAKNEYLKSEKEYLKWKARFPKDLNSLRNDKSYESENIISQKLSRCQQNDVSFDENEVWKQIM